MPLRIPLFFVTFILATTLHAFIDNSFIYQQYPYPENANLISNISFFSLVIVIILIFELTKLNKIKVRTNYGLIIIVALLCSAVILKI